MKKLFIIIVIFLIIYKIENNYNNNITFHKFNFFLTKNLKINTIYTNYETYFKGLLPISYIPFFNNTKANINYNDEYKIYDLRYKNQALLLSFFKTNDIFMDNTLNYLNIRLDEQSNFTNLFDLKSLCIDEILQCKGQIYYKSLDINFSYKNNIFKYILNTNKTTLVILFFNNFKNNGILIKLFNQFNLLKNNKDKAKNIYSEFNNKKDKVIEFYKEKVILNNLNKYK